MRLGKQYVVPAAVIVLGIGWLLNVQGVLPKVDWIWTCGLAAAGILILAVYGLDKLTGVLGPFLIVSSICALLRQTGRLSADKEIPILTIVLGVLLLIVNVFKVRTPEAMKDEKPG